MEVLISTQPNKFYSMQECCNDHLSAGHFRFSPGGAARKRRGRAVYRTRKGRRGAGPAAADSGTGFSHVTATCPPPCCSAASSLARADVPVAPVAAHADKDNHRESPARAPAHAPAPGRGPAILHAGAGARSPVVTPGLSLPPGRVVCRTSSGSPFTPSGCAADSRR